MRQLPANHIALDKKRLEKNTKTSLAKKLGIARSSLYYQPKKPGKNEAVKVQIIAVMSEHAAFGHRRVGYALGMNHKKTNVL